MHEILKSKNSQEPLIHEGDFNWNELQSAKIHEEIKRIVLQLVEERLDGVILSAFEKEFLDAYLAKLQIFTTIPQTLKFRSEIYKDKYTRSKKYREAMQLFFLNACQLGEITDPTIYLPRGFFSSNIPRNLLHELSHAADKLIWIILALRVAQSDQEAAMGESESNQERLNRQEKYLGSSKNPALEILALPICLSVYLTIDKPAAYFLVGLVLLLSHLNTRQYFQSPDEIVARETEKRVAK